MGVPKRCLGYDTKWHLSFSFLYSFHCQRKAHLPNDYSWLFWSCQMVKRITYKLYMYQYLLFFFCFFLKPFIFTFLFFCYSPPKSPDLIMMESPTTKRQSVYRKAGHARGSEKSADIDDIFSLTPTKNNVSIFFMSRYFTISTIVSLFSFFFFFFSLSLSLSLLLSFQSKCQ